MNEKKINNSIKLKNVSNSDYSFLYKILKERKPIVNISHKKIPTYRQHVNFTSSKPYSKWYIIYFNSKKVGSIYLSKQNEIGIFILKQMQGEEYEQIALEILMDKNPRDRYIVNCNPKNKKLISFWKKNKFKLIQYSYELVN